MAEKDEQEQIQEQQDQASAQGTQNKKKKEMLVTGGIMGGIILVFALSGFFLGKVLVETLKPEPIVAAQIGATGPMGQAIETDEGSETKEAGDGKTWFYDLPPVVANLDEPGATRYVRMALTLEILDSLDRKDGEPMLEEKDPHMRNWLTIYLSSLSLDDARGEKNLKRIQSHMLEELNQILFPNAQPQISSILLKDFAIQ